MLSRGWLGLGFPLIPSWWEPSNPHPGHYLPVDRGSEAIPVLKRKLQGNFPPLRNLLGRANDPAPLFKKT